MKSGKGLFLISVIAGIFSWVLNAFFEGSVFSGSGRTFIDHLINVPPEEFFDRVITFLVFIVFGLIVSGLYEKRHAAEEKLSILATELQQSNRELEQFAAIALTCSPPTSPTGQGVSSLNTLSEKPLFHPENGSCLRGVCGLFRLIPSIFRSSWPPSLTALSRR